MLADTLPLAAAKGEIRKSGTMGRLVRTKAIRIEPCWIGKMLRTAMRHVLAQVKFRAPTNRRSAWQRVISQGHADEDPSGRIEPHGFVQHLPGISEFRNVIQQRI